MTMPRWKLRYQKYKELGMCVQGCGHVAVEGRVLCSGCAVKFRNKIIIRQHYYRKNGRCVQCGRDATDGRSRCEPCAEKNNKSSMAWAKRNRV